MQRNVENIFIESEEPVERVRSSRKVAQEIPANVGTFCCPNFFRQVPVILNDR